MASSDAFWGYFFIAPFMLVALIFLLFPMGYSFYLSLREAGLYASWFDQFGEMKFVGLKNYITLVQSPVFWYSLLATAIYAILFIPTMIAAALALALILGGAKQLPGYRTIRGLFFLPHVFDVFVIGVIWLLLFNPSAGPLASLLDWIGINWFSRHGFVDNPITVLPSIAFVMVLKTMGFGMILFLTALNTIPESIFEAAEIDGASSRQKLIHVTLPLLKPMILFLIITSLANILNAFTEFYALTNGTGGPSFSFWGETVQTARVSGFHLFRIFDAAFYGQAAAMSFILLLLALVVTALNFRLLGRS